MEEERKWCVYCHTNKINDKKYIGITCQNPRRRWGLKGQGYKTQYFKRAIEKYGWDNFKHEVLFENLLEEEAKLKEIELILLNKTKDKNFGYNMTDGGDGTCGIIISEETRKNLRESHLGQVAWNKGMKGQYVQSEPSIVSRKLKWQDEEYYKKQMLSHIGNKHSYETKIKISKNNKKSKKIFQIDLCGKIVKVWNSMAEINRDKYYMSKNIRTKIYPSSVIFNNFIWIREENYSDEIIDNIINGKIEKLKKEKPKCIKTTKKFVFKYDVNMNLLEKYSSVKLASIKNNIDRTTIRKYSNNGKIYGEFYFKIKETDEE